MARIISQEDADNFKDAIIRALVTEWFSREGFFGGRHGYPEPKGGGSNVTSLTSQN